MIRRRSRNAEKLILEKTKRKVELAKEEISVKSDRLTNKIVIPLIIHKLTQGISRVRSFMEKTHGRASSWAITFPSRAVPNRVALIAEAVDSTAPNPIRINPVWPRKGLAAMARAYSLYFII